MAKKTSARKRQSEPEAVEVEAAAALEDNYEQPAKPEKPRTKGAKLSNIDRPCGMKARAEHHLASYEQMLRRTPHGGPGFRTAEVVISVCRDILSESDNA